jgi:hypothetical protein
VKRKFSTSVKVLEVALEDREYGRIFEDFADHA